MKKVIPFAIEGDRTLCCGCRACEQVCKHAALSMIQDDEGFQYPRLDEAACKDCGACVRVCPIGKEPSRAEQGFPRVFAAWARSPEIRKASSSGGLFPALARAILASGGVVFGATWDKDFNVVHVKVERPDDLPKLQGSKYVQSDTISTYGEVRALLKEGTQVYFTGTPCQVAGLKSFLGKNRDGLVTTDLVCHGVPSPGVWRSALRAESDAAGGTIRSVSMRHPTRWGVYRLDLGFSLPNSDRIRHRVLPWQFFPFLFGFRRDLILRPICHTCPYANTEREGDITLADYWGVRDVHPGLSTHEGVSAAIVNTEVGARLWEDALPSIEAIPSTLDGVVAGNGNLRGRTPRPEGRDRFFEDYGREGYHAAARKHLLPPRPMALRVELLFQGIRRRVRAPRILKAALRRLRAGTKDCP